MANEITRQIMANLTGLSAGACDSAGTYAAPEVGRSEQYDLTSEEEDKLLGLIGQTAESRNGFTAANGKPWPDKEPDRGAADMPRKSGRPAGTVRGGFLTLDELADQV